jgi:hypothetical protein
MQVNNIGVADFHDITNALKGGPSVPAEVSFNMHWSGVQKRFHLHDKQKKFDAQVIQDSATIGWSASRQGFKFVSDAANTSTTVFASIAQESNGVFFS